MNSECPRCRSVLEFTDRVPRFCPYCGQALVDVQPRPTATFDHEATTAYPASQVIQPHRAPEVLGGYRMQRLIGQGGMGAVYEAEEIASGRHVALKLVASAFDPSPETMERFRREGRLASTIAHPRCVFVLRADEEAGQPYIVMELMPGSTLKDLVDEHGPLPPEDAIRKILDVMEGLQEAHRLHVIHRDVKPSNCFLEADGRVKVGDFGLAKSLVTGGHLTQTGAFIGTPFFASPEQFKTQKLDRRTDVYSAAATLYYLLTGKPPFHDSDAAAAVARKSSEQPPSLRLLQPNLSPGLDYVVLRGLDRDRDRRWSDLGEFRQALLPFLPEYQTPGTLRLRFGALAIDGLLVGLPYLLFLVLMPESQGPILKFLDHWLDAAILGAYFLILERVWGCSLGKRLLRLRVCGRDGIDPPSWLQTLVRTLAFYGLILFPTGLAFYLFDSEKRPGPYFSGLAFSALGTLSTLLCMLLNRARRGPHEWLSGSRTLQLPWLDQRRPLLIDPQQFVQPVADLPAGCPARLGPFQVKGSLPGVGDGRVLLGHDTLLGREVWIWLRPTTERPLSDVRRNVSRTTRLRWLAGDCLGDEFWDAFLAPAGCPLTHLMDRQQRLPWPHARALLEQLTAELQAGCADGTLPAELSEDQIWVDADCRLYLADLAAEDSSDLAGLDERGRQQQALSLLRRVVILTLEGKSRPRRDSVPRINAPVPVHAQRLARRLFGEDDAYTTLGQLTEELTATRSLPTEVTRARRVAFVTSLLPLILVPLLAMFLLNSAALAFFKATLIYSLARHRQDTARVIQDFERQAPQDAANVHLLFISHPMPVARVAGAYQAHGDQQLLAFLHERLEKDLVLDRQLRFANDRWTSAVLSWAESDEDGESSESAAGRTWWAEIGDSIRQAASKEDTASPDRQDPRMAAMSASGELLSLEFLFVSKAAVMILAGFTLLCVLPWPILWILTAFVSRGGLTLQLTNLALVRSNGKKALRLQCAWRALLVWAPVTILLVLHGLLDAWHWVSARPTTPHTAIAVLARLCWYAALALVLLYIVLYIWLPGRRLHDRLSGTYLVPR
jgi:uncharacterized RDD family membrane protein YckC